MFLGHSPSFREVRAGPKAEAEEEAATDSLLGLVPDSASLLILPRLLATYNGPLTSIINQDNLSQTQVGLVEATF